LAHVEQVFAELAKAGHDQLKRDGINPAQADFRYFADLRYVGQEHAISIPVESAGLLCSDDRTIRTRFDFEHHRRYAQSAPKEEMEIVSLRLVVTAARADTVAEECLSQPWQPDGDAETAWRDVVFDNPEKPVKTQILWRPALPAGTRITGPAVIEEPNSTTLIHPGDVVTVTEAGHLIITLAY